MILTAPRDRDRNVKNKNASNFIKRFQISLKMTFRWHVWYQFEGNRILHITMPILLLQSDQVWIFGM